MSGGYPCCCGGGSGRCRLCSSCLNSNPRFPNDAGFAPCCLKLTLTGMGTYTAPCQCRDCYRYNREYVVSYNSSGIGDSPPYLAHACGWTGYVCNSASEISYCGSVGASDPFVLGGGVVRAGYDRWQVRFGSDYRLTAWLTVPAPGLLMSWISEPIASTRPDCTTALDGPIYLYPYYIGATPEPRYYNCDLTDTVVAIEAIKTDTFAACPSFGSLCSKPVGCGWLRSGLGPTSFTVTIPDGWTAGGGSCSLATCKNMVGTFELEKSGPDGNQACTYYYSSALFSVTLYLGKTLQPSTDPPGCYIRVEVKSKTCVGGAAWGAYPASRFIWDTGECVACDGLNIGTASIPFSVATDCRYGGGNSVTVTANYN